MPNLFQPVSYRKGAAWAVGSTAAWKLCSFINGILIALYFGAHTQTDIYFYLIMICGMGVNLLQHINTAVFIPEAICADKRSPGSGMRLLNSVLFFYAGLGVICIAAGALYPQHIAGAISRFAAGELRQNTAMVTLVCTLFAFQIWASFLCNILEMRRLFGSAWLTPANALFPLLFLVAAAKSWGIICMVYGFLAANIMQCLVFLYLLKTRCEWKFAAGLEGFHSRLKKNLLTSQMLEIISLINTWLPVYLISGLGSGLVSALNYAKQLSDSPTEILTWRVCAVNKIELSEDAARKDDQSLNVHFLRTNRFLLFLLMPLAVFSCFYALDIIRLFFERGNFTMQAARQAAAFLQPLLGMMILFVPITMQNNLFSAQRKLKEAFPYLLVSNLIFTGAVIWGIKQWGAFAFPYVQIVCCLIGFAINKKIFDKYFTHIYYTRSLMDMARLAAINLVALVPAAACTCLCAFKTPFFTLLTGGIVFLVCLYALTRYSGDWQLFIQAARHNSSLPSALPSSK